MGKEAAAANGGPLAGFPTITPAESGQRVVDFINATAKDSPYVGVLVDVRQGAPYTVFPF